MLHGGLRANPIQHLKPAILGQFQIQEHEAWKWEPLSIRIPPVSIQIIYCLATVPDDLQRIKQPRSFHGVLHEKHIILGVLYQQNGASIGIHALHNTPQIQAWKSLYKPVSFAAQPSFLAGHSICLRSLRELLFTPPFRSALSAPSALHPCLPAGRQMTAFKFVPKRLPSSSKACKTL